MTVSEAMQLASLSAARVVAGQGGLGNAITGAMVLEATDIENWGREGQLLITSFYALRDLTGEELEGFFAKLSAIGISGIVFKAERLVNSAPQAVTALCGRYGIPLLEIPKEVKYESILMDVLGQMLDSNLTLLNHFFEVHHQMMALALRQPTVAEILRYLKNALHADATFLDNGRDRRVGSDPAQSAFVRIALEELAPDRYQHYRYCQAVLDYDSGFSAAALAVPVPSSDGGSYTLVIHNGPRAFDPIHIMTIENVVSLLQMEILKQNAIDQKLFIQNNNAVHDLLGGRYPSRERVDGVLAELGLDRGTHYQVLLVSVQLSPQEEPRRAQVMLAVRRQVKSAWPGLAYFENNDQIIFLHSCAGPARLLRPQEVAPLLEELSQKDTLPPFTYLAALSQSGDRYAIPARNREVMDIYRLFGHHRGESQCLRYEDLGAYKLFLEAETPAQLEGYIDPRVLRLRREAPDLLTTLVVLCENNLSYQRTARRLFLHPKTVQYRAARVQQSYGLDIHDAEDFLQILLAGKILLLLGEHP